MTSAGKGAEATGGEAYGQWAAPRADGALLIWPEASTLADIARRNAALLASAKDVRIGGLPLPELRRQARAFLGHHDERPLVMTGHQCELHHPGVWVKNALICSVAEAAEGSALHVAVDTDAPRHLKLRWPGFAAPITDDPRLNSAAWSGLLDPPTPAHVDHLIESAHGAAEEGLVSPLVLQFLRGCRAYLVDQRDAIAPLDLASTVANAQHALDWSLGLQYSALTLSGLLRSEPWARFVLHLAADAEGFARACNSALADYRSDAGITTADRPAPDLLVMRQEVEMPFWLDDLSRGTRARAALRRRDGRFVLSGPRGGDLELQSDDPQDPRALLGWLARHQLRLSPRALSLTIFLRLCVCDLFVHGIGGGHYDQVSDRLIRNYFGIAPPAFAVATATLHHPLALQRQRVDLPRLRQEGHRIAHGVLGDEKRQWLERIETASDPHERRGIFSRMHEARRARLEQDPDFRAWQRRMAEAERALDAEAEVFDRELFYAIQPEQRLRALIEQVEKAVRGT